MVGKIDPKFSRLFRWGDESITKIFDMGFIFIIADYLKWNIGNFFELGINSLFFSIFNRNCFSKASISFG